MWSERPRYAVTTRGALSLLGEIETDVVEGVVATRFAEALGDQVQVIGFSGCYPNEYAAHMLARLCTHPNVGATLIVSLGCEGLIAKRTHNLESQYLRTHARGEA